MRNANAWRPQPIFGADGRLFRILANLHDEDHGKEFEHRPVPMHSHSNLYRHSVLARS